MTPEQAAFGEAERRIAAWREGETLDLAIDDLAEIPAAIGRLQTLAAVRLSYYDEEEGVVRSARQIADLAPLAGLTALQSLDCEGTQIADLAPLSGLAVLQSLDCSATQITDLAPLSKLAALQSLDCSATQISDLAPLAGLVALRTLDCWDTQIADLAPLAGLAALQTLNCRFTRIADLTPLAGLAALQTLDCSHTQIADLAPLSGLTALQSLACWRTQIADLAPLAGLTALQSLYCSHTQIADLAPLSGLTALQTFDSEDTRIADLSPLAGLTALQTLDCSGTQVSDLTQLYNNPALATLDASSCRLGPVDRDFWFKPSLRRLHLFKSFVPGIPAEALSQDRQTNCLDELRAHLADLGKDPAPMREAKLIVLGNGRVGKTQLCRNLRGEPYDPSIASTHGVIADSLPTPGAAGGAFRLWDFGGQDIYHGTHGLFIRSRAVFVVAWTPEMEDNDTPFHDGMSFRNYPLAYWFDYVAEYAGTDVPLIVVQTQCDRPADEQAMPPELKERFDRFTHRKWLHFSASEKRGVGALNEALAEAYESLNQPLIGEGRRKVKGRLEAMLAGDAKRQPLDRLHRTLGKQDFLEFCAEEGGISNPDLFLKFLHNAGTVFHRQGLFGDRLILDQGWALDAIYSVFHRGKCYPTLKRLGGRFTRAELGNLIWDEAGHSPEEQKLFLSMMRQCGICFVHRRASEDEEAEYIAPELLPAERPDHELADRWDEAGETQEARFEFPILSPAIMRVLMSGIGAQAGTNGVYWRNGFYVYERKTSARAIIEQKFEGWRGEITVRTQQGRAAELLEHLVREVERVTGVRATKRPQMQAPKREEAILAEPNYGTDRTGAPALFISYAWKDDRTLEGLKREEDVERLLEAARQRRIDIRRDKDRLNFGDSITNFMNQIAAGDRIFVFLSEKYLKSPFCMYELHEIWRRSRMDPDEFSKRIRIFTLDDASIWTIPDRLKASSHWKSEFTKLKAVVDEHGSELLSELDHRAYRLMSAYAFSIGEILTSIADRVQPRSFEDFLKYGLDDLPGAGPPAA